MSQNIVRLLRKRETPDDTARRHVEQQGIHIYMPERVHRGKQQQIRISQARQMVRDWKNLENESFTEPYWRSEFDNLLRGTKNWLAEMRHTNAFSPVSMHRLCKITSDIENQEYFRENRSVEEHNEHFAFAYFCSTTYRHLEAWIAQARLEMIDITGNPYCVRIEGYM